MNKAFRDYCVTLLNAGFTLLDYTNNRDYTYSVIVSPNDSIGYIQKTWYNKNAVDLSKECKPSKETGTGLLVYEGVVNPTVELAIEVCNKPYGNPYLGIDDYIAYNNKKWSKVSGMVRVIRNKEELIAVEEEQNNDNK